MGKIVRVTPNGVISRDPTPEEEAELKRLAELEREEAVASHYRVERELEYETTFGVTWQETLDWIAENGFDKYVTEKAKIKNKHKKPANLKVK